MPLVTPKPIETPPPNPIVTITKPEFRSNVVDTKYTPEGSLLTNIEGAPWIVNYYSQVIAADNTIAGQRVSREAAHEQFVLIVDMELRVTNPHTYSQNAPDKQSNSTGAAHVYPFVIPNVGDMFIADVGDGREGLFQITTSEKRSLYKESVHFIEYTLVGYATEERKGDLQHKTVNTLVFVRDFLLYGQNPLVEPEDFAIIRELHRRHRSMLEQWLRSYNSNEFNTIVIPGQEAATYDHFLMKAVKKFFTSWDTDLIVGIRTLNCDGDNAMLTTTIWDAIAQRDTHMLPFIAEEAGLCSTQLFERQAMLEGIYYSGIQYVVYPIDPAPYVDDDFSRGPRPVATNKLRPVAPRSVKMKFAVAQSNLNGFGSYGDQTEVPNIFPVVKDDYYIFSKAFYDNVPGEQSRLELCVRDYLNKKPQDNKVLLSLCDQYHSWEGLERFYYTPILLILMRACIRRF
jgi:hypothetical protein